MVQGSIHWLLSHICEIAQSELERQPATHLTPWQISVVLQSESDLQISWQKLSIHNSLAKQASSELHKGLQNLAWHWNPLGHWLFATQVVEAPAHPTTAVGLGKNPGIHEHWAFWSETVHWELGPHEAWVQGSVHLFPTQDCEVGQSKGCLQPTEQAPLRQTWPKKQSLSSLQVSLHWPKIKMISDKNVDVNMRLEMNLNIFFLSTKKVEEIFRITFM